jgi:hypothetical protein
MEEDGWAVVQGSGQRKELTAKGKVASRELREIVEECWEVIKEDCAPVHQDLSFWNTRMTEFSKTGTVLLTAYLAYSSDPSK